MRLVLRETQLSFRRAPVLSALSITTIAFALFVLGLFGLIALNLRSALATLEERVEVVAYLRRGTPVEVVTVAISDVEALPGVESVTYVREDEALERARRELTEFQDVFDDLATNPLPASLEVRMKPGFRNTRSVQQVAQWLRGLRFAEDVRFGRDWVQKLDRIRNIAGLVGLIIGAAFAVASIIIIGTTVRMSVLHRSREIAIMRLVGATDGFIRRPFLLDGTIKGALGGICAVALNYGAYVAINPLFRASFFRIEQAFLLVLFGTVLGFLASALSVGRHLKHVTTG
ncbi:MAG: cell division protein FtsX [Gemmatimonadales bacterium]